MDPIRFDGFVKAWGRGSRRRALSLFSGGLVGLVTVATSQPTAARRRHHHHHHHGHGGGGGCTPQCVGLECGDDGCGGSCGSCGVDQTCQGGTCVGGGGCGDLLSSSANCGTCGHACPADHPSCSHGNCCSATDCICSPAGFACDAQTHCENSGLNCDAGGCLPSGVCP